MDGPKLAASIAVLRVAFERWIDYNDRELPQLVREALDQIELFATRTGGADG